MKAQFKLRFVHESHSPGNRPERKRVAYLLRAARSRRRDNIQREAGGYFIRDCSVRLSRLPAVAA